MPPVSEIHEIAAARRRDGVWFLQSEREAARNVVLPLSFLEEATAERCSCGIN